MIKRIDLGDIDCETFIANYFSTDIPLILTNSLNSNSLFFTHEILLKALKDSGVQNKLWIQTTLDFTPAKEVTPKIVKHCLNPSLSHLKDRPLRIWSNNEGDRTLLHLDANGLYSFNMQVKGHKRWRIYPPCTDFRMYAFSNIPHLRHNSLAQKSADTKLFYDFILGPGDILFLPAYWFHEVEVLHGPTINFNWVGTKRVQSLNEAMRREAALFKFLLPVSHIPLISDFIDLTCGSKEVDYFTNFAGTGGRELVRKRAALVTPLECLLTLVRELTGLPRLLFSLNKIQKFSRSKLFRSS